MADEDLGTGTVTIVISDVQAERSLDALAEKIEQKLDRAARVAGRRIELAVARSIRRISPARIEIEADLSRFNALLRTQTDLSDIEIKVPAVPKVSVTQWKRMIQEAVAGIEIKIKVVPDVSGFDRRIREITTPTIRARVETSVDNDRLTRSLSVIGSAAGSAAKQLGSFATSALKIGSIGIAAASAAQSVIGLVGALAPAAGIVAAAPAAILGFAGALGALKIALSGVGDAFGAALSGNSEKFQKALERLSPAAQSVAKELRALKPEFDGIKNSVQDAFFGQLQGQLTAITKNLAGSLRPGLAGVAAEFGRVALNASSYLKTAEATNNVTSILTGTRKVVAGLADGAHDLVAGFLQAGDAISRDFAGRLGNSIADVSDRFGQFLSSAASDGRLTALVEGAITVFKQLGTIVSNIGSVLAGVFKAANEVGGGFLNNLIAITGQFKEFVNSAQGQEALQNIFKALSSVAAQAAPIIAALATQLGKIAPSLAPLFTTIGPAIVSLINSLGPAIQGILPGVQALVEGLADGFEQIENSGALPAIGQAIGQIAQAIAPVLPVVGQLIGSLGSALAPVLAALAPVLDAVVGVIGILVTALQPLFVVVGQLAAQIGPILTPIFVALGQVIAALSPLLQTAADILGAVLGPILAVLPGLIQPFLDAVVRLVQAVLPPFNALLVELEPSLLQIVDALVQVATALIPVITLVADLAVKSIAILMPLLTPLIELIGKVAAVFSGLLANTLNNVVVPALNAVALFLKGDFSGAFQAIKETVRGALDVVKQQFIELPGKILLAVANISFLLFDVGTDLVKGMINGIKSAAGALVSSVKDVVGDAINGAKALLGIHSPSRVFYDIGTNTAQGLINGLDAMARNVTDAATSLAAAAVAPFTGLSVNGPTVNGVNSGSALAAITQPFGSSATNRLTTVAPSRQTAAQGFSGGNGPVFQNTFNITEVGNAETTAERVISRQVAAAGVFL